MLPLGRQDIRLPSSAAARASITANPPRQPRHPTAQAQASPVLSKENTTSIASVISNASSLLEKPKLPAEQLTALARYIESYDEGVIVGEYAEKVEGVWATILHRLRIPQDWGNVEDEDDPELILAQTRHREAFRETLPAFVALAHAIVHRKQSCPSLDSACADYIRLACLLPHGFASPPELSNVLARLHFLHPALPAHMLTQVLPQYFVLHPKISVEGRALDRPRGGEKAMLDYWEDGSWETVYGIEGVLDSIFSCLSAEDVEQRWRYVLPPLLAFLDAPASYRKLAGVRLLSRLLSDRKLNGDHLRRTGTSQILLQSLFSATHNLTSPQSSTVLPLALRAAIALLSLVHISPRTPSQKAFDDHIDVFSTFVIHTFQFAPHNIRLQRATCAVLPELLDAMGSMATIRFLSLLVDRLSALISIDPNGNEGAIAMREVMHRAQVANRWSEKYALRTASGIARGWEALGLNGNDRRKVEGEQLKRLWQDLVAFPDDEIQRAMEEFSSRLRRLDDSFEELVGA